MISECIPSLWTEVYTNNCVIHIDCHPLLKDGSCELTFTGIWTLATGVPFNFYTLQYFIKFHSIFVFVILPLYSACISLLKVKYRIKKKNCYLPEYIIVTNEYLLGKCNS